MTRPELPAAGPAQDDDAAPNHRPCPRPPAVAQEDADAGHLPWGTNIGMVTITLSVTADDPGSLDTDVIVIGVIEATGGPQPAPGAERVVEAFGGELAGTLALLGATGKAEEVTKLPTDGRLRAPVIAAVGLGRRDGGSDGSRDGSSDGRSGATGPDGAGARESLRRAAGAAMRAGDWHGLSPRHGALGAHGALYEADSLLAADPRPRRGNRRGARRAAGRLSVR